MWLAEQSLITAIHLYIKKTCFPAVCLFKIAPTLYFNPSSFPHEILTVLQDIQYTSQCTYGTLCNNKKDSKLLSGNHGVPRSK